MSPHADADQYTSLRRSWKLGGEDFRDWLLDKAAPRGKGVRVSERWETDIALAERLVTQTLAKPGWQERDLVTRPKGDRSKVEIAHQLRTKTPVSYQWIADRAAHGQRELCLQPAPLV